MRISLVYIFGYFVVLLRTSWYFLVLLGTQGGGEQKGRLEWENHLWSVLRHSSTSNPIQNQNNTLQCQKTPERGEAKRKNYLCCVTGTSLYFCVFLGTFGYSKYPFNKHTREGLESTCVVSLAADDRLSRSPASH